MLHECPKKIVNKRFPSRDMPRENNNSNRSSLFQALEKRRRRCEQAKGTETVVGVSSLFAGQHHLSFFFRFFFFLTPRYLNAWRRL